MSDAVFVTFAVGAVAVTYQLITTSYKGSNDLSLKLFATTSESKSQLASCVMN